MKQKFYDIFSPVGVILILANLFFLNLWTSKLFSRIDLTENKVYTLSDVTKDILRELEEPLTIKAFFTRDLPAPHNNTARYVEDQLAEMKAYGGSKFRYEFKDPSDEEELKKEAQNFRLEPMQVNEMRRDKVEFKLVYLGMALIYEDQQEVIPVIQPQNLGNLEYEILSKIKRLTDEEMPTIGFLGGHGEADLRENLTQLDNELRKLYDLKPVNISTRNAVPDNIDLLCIIGPKEDIPESDRFAIDQFIMRGGKVLMALNKVDADISQMSAKRGNLRIDPWTENYGFRVTDDLVMDLAAPLVPFQTVTRFGWQRTYMQYHHFLEIVNLNRDNIAMNNLRQVRFYFPTSIDTTLAAENDSISVTPLLFSSEKSAIQSAPFDINPMTQRAPYVWDQANLPLGVYLQGKFTSFWEGKEVPKNEDGDPITDDEVIPRSSDTRMVVFADAHFLQDQFIVPGMDNLTMMLNLVDWLLQDERLISIRARDVSSRPIDVEKIANWQRVTLKYTNLFLPPLLVIAFGIIWWMVRSMKRKRMEYMRRNHSQEGM